MYNVLVCTKGISFPPSIYSTFNDCKAYDSNCYEAGVHTPKLHSYPIYMLLDVRSLMETNVREYQQGNQKWPIQQAT